MTLTILFITHLIPCPPYGGELIRCYNCIDSLTQHFKVVVLAPQVEPDCALRVKVQDWHNLPNWSQSSLGRIRHTLKPNVRWQQCLRMLCQQYQPQITWFDYGHWGHYALIPKQFGSLTVMSTSNAQADLTKQALYTKPLTRWHILYLLSYWAEVYHENRYFRHFDYISSVSESDRQYHSRFVDDEHNLILPNYINENWYPPSKPNPPAKNVLMMTGNFNAFQNRQGLIWFFNQVWPEVRRQIPEIALHLVGKGTETLKRILKGQANVKCIGQVSSVGTYLRQATIAIVPLLHGSGSRFKILEALACETPVVSTTLGAAGINLTTEKEAILADSSQAFISGILTLLKNQQKRLTLAKNGLVLLKKQYGFEVNTHYLQNLILEIVDS